MHCVSGEEVHRGRSPSLRLRSPYALMPLHSERRAPQSPSSFLLLGRPCLLSPPFTLLHPLSFPALAGRFSTSPSGHIYITCNSIN
ncbi:hypothetical protein Bca52824_050538 [Brassica carinata]|uniref:Uncharacterized protein n=1 Tax=Brassica carinata TaxID=52824 RepID=A0A8X7R3W4_BRACI|nr:hypothetical protein Bca52824_050538 [Brassica carinata]